MDDNRGIGPMKMEGNLADNWRLWRARFQNYLIASEMTKKDEATQCAQLLHYIGEEGFRIYTTFTFDYGQKDKLKALLAKFDHHFMPQDNLLCERIKFFSYRQQPGESTEQFVAELRHRAMKCKLDKLQDELIEVMILCGSYSPNVADVREKLVQDDSHTLEQTIELCKMMEAKEMEKSKVVAVETVQEDRIQKHKEYVDYKASGMEQSSQHNYVNVTQETLPPASIQNHNNLDCHILETDVCSMSLESYQCNNCDFSKPFRMDLMKHQNNCKNVTIRVEQHDESSGKTTQRFYCRYCSYHTNVEEYLKRHIVITHMKRLKCSQCSYRTGIKFSLKQHEIKQHGIQHANMKWFKCDMCSYQTVRKSHLQRHCNRHTPKTGEVFKCKHCDYETKAHYQLAKHIYYLHTDAKCVKWFQCEECDLRTKYKSGLTRHMRRKHGEQKPLLECSQCDFKTRSADYLKSHEKNAHTPEAQIIWHQCQHCEYKAKRSRELKDHMRRMHGIEEQTSNLIVINAITNAN